MALKTLTDQQAVNSFINRSLPASGAVIASGDYKTTDPAPAEMTIPNQAATLKVVVDITAVSGAGATLTVNIEGFDPASGKWITLLTSAALTSVATTQLHVSPYMTAAANLVAQSSLTEVVRVRPVGTGTRTTLTYSVGAAVSL